MAGKKRKLKLFMTISLSLLAVNILIFSVMAAKVLKINDQYGENTPDINDANQVSPYLTHYLAQELWNRTQEKEPFELVVEQAGINDVIGRDSIVSGGWPIYADPMVIYSPNVRFEPGNLVLLGKIQYKAIEVFLTLYADGEILDDGRMKINVQKVQAGKLDVTSVARYMAKEMSAGLFLDPNSLSVNDRMIYGIIYDKPFEPVFYVGSDAIRLVGVEIEQEKLILNFVPEKM